VTRSATLWTRGNTEDALEAARAMPRFEEPISAKVAELMARARTNEGMCLAKLDHFGDARATFEEILALTVDPDDDGLIEDVLRAAYNNALALKELRCPDEALECSRVSIERFRNSPGKHARPVLASVMLSYGRDLVAHGRESEAMSIFDELLLLLDASDSDTLHANYAHAQTERAKILQGRGDLMGAAGAHRAVFERFSVVSDGYPAHAAAWAGVAAMRLLSKGRRPDELTAIAQAVRARYRGSKDPYLRARVRNVSVVAIMMPPANRAVDAVERRPRAYALAAATASVAAIAAWARRRARRP
jgi:tetratricopeptide (TPR) repeat protein